MRTDGACNSAAGSQLTERSVLGHDAEPHVGGSRPQRGLNILLGTWFEDTDEIQALDRRETDAFADRQRVGYRFSISNPEGRFVIEQQAYLTPRNGKV
jgi:hypothetical protein